MLQNSPEWRVARCGSVGASEVPDVVRRVKSGISAARANLLSAKVLERLTGTPYEGYRSRAMLEGLDRQPAAAAAYSFMFDRKIEPGGLVPHPRIIGAHASPDGLIAPDGLVEIKCPEPSAHLLTLRTEKIDRDYLAQMAWQLACTGRAWCDYVSWSPEFPEPMQLFVKRFDREGEFVADLIAELELEVEQFVSEIDYHVAGLKARFDLAEAAA